MNNSSLLIDLSLPNRNQFIDKYRALKIGIIIILGFFPGLVMSSEFSKYHFLYENNVDSDSYEIRKIINGDIGAVLYSKNTDSVLVVANRYLWKINKAGYIVDSFYGVSGLRNTGIKLRTDSWSDNHDKHHWHKRYSDWFYTGNKAERTITKITDSNKYSDNELLNRFNEADIVEFYKTPNSGKQGLKVALLKEKQHWTAINITKRFGDVDEDCREFKNNKNEIYHQSCLEGFNKVDKYTLQPLESKLPYNFSLSDKNIPFSIRKFEKQTYFYEEGFGLWVLGKTVGKILKSQGIPGTLPDSYWCGTGYIDFRYRSEMFQFKAFVTTEGGEPELQRLSYYAPPEGTGWDTAFLQLYYKGGVYDRYDREKGLNQYQKKGIGLYVIRKRNNPRELYLSLVKNNLITLGKPNSYRLNNPWWPVFSGLFLKDKFKQSTWGDVQFFNTTDTYHYLINPDFVKSNLYSIPKTLSIDWDGNNIDTSYKLYFHDNQYIWLDLNRFGPRPHFKLVFDEAEAVKAFKHLDAHNLALKLDINITSITEDIGTISVTLRSQNNEYKLQHVVLQTEGPIYTESKTENKENQIIFEKGQLWTQNEETKQNGHKLNDYIQLANMLVDKSPYARKYASLITAQTVKFFVDRVENNDYKTAKQIFYDYVNHLMPKLTSKKQSDDVTYNISVFASQGLALSSITSDPDISKTVFEKLISDNFDIVKQNNPTFMYNLACFYSLHQQKSLMLKAMAQSLKLGKAHEKFKKDGDFKQYWNDPDFNQLLTNFQQSLDINK